uniref:Coiled-coil domain-containing protein 70 n=1 Tax=Amazona collaria TaxID=241587 RepID=A0A8B9FSR7_9PSIT
TFPLSVGKEVSILRNSANLSNLEKKQLCRILKEEKRNFKKEIKAFCHAHKNFHDEIKAFHKETKAKALWNEIKIFTEKNKVCMEEIKNVFQEQADQEAVINKILQGKYKALQQNNKTFWKDSEFLEEGQDILGGRAGHHSQQTDSLERIYSSWKNDWRIQKEKGALWDVMEVLRNVYIPPGKEKLLEREENNLCGNYGPDVDTRNKTPE